MTTTVVVDDVDPKIVYTGPWVAYSGTTGEHDMTGHSLSPGTAGKVTFKFRGTSVTVHGRVDKLGDNWGGVRPPSSSYNVDGAFPRTYVPSLGVGPQFGVQFYHAESLSDGEHTLNIAANVPNPFGSRFRLDYIEYTPSFAEPNTVRLPENSGTAVSPSFSTIGSTSQTSSASSIIATSSSSTTALTTTSAITSLTGNSVSSANQESNSSTDIPGSTTQSEFSVGISPTDISPTPVAASKAKNPTGAIIGATIGGIFLLVIIAVSLYFWRKRFRRRVSNLRPYSTDMFSSARPRKGSEKQSFTGDDDQPPPWSPEEANNTQEILSLLRAANLQHYPPGTPAPEYRSAIQPQV